MLLILVLIAIAVAYYTGKSRGVDEGLRRGAVTLRTKFPKVIPLHVEIDYATELLECHGFTVESRWMTCQYCGTEADGDICTDCRYQLSGDCDLEDEETTCCNKCGSASVTATTDGSCADCDCVCHLQGFVCTSKNCETAPKWEVPF